MHQWIWEHKNWHHFTRDDHALSGLLAQARLAQGKLLGTVNTFSQKTKAQLSAQMLTDEMVTTSEIEGALLDRESVCSSIQRRLGLSDIASRVTNDRYIEGLLDIMLDATGNYHQPLTLERLYGWHAGLFPIGYSGIQKILAGQLRGEGPMQIISGRPGKIKIHYVAPPHDTLKKLTTE